MWPRLFSGVLERTFVSPAPAVEGLSPLGPDGVTAACSGVGCAGVSDCLPGDVDDVDDVGDVGDVIDPLPI